MKVSYNKLWRLMLDRKVRKTELKKMTGISFAKIQGWMEEK